MVCQGKLMHFPMLSDVLPMVSQFCGLTKWLLNIEIDNWATIVTKIIIPVIKCLHNSLVPSSFVDGLLWLPSKSIQKPYISYSEIGSSEYIKCSEIATTDEVFGNVVKQ